MRKLKGFTLIELLVVVAIIGILATVVVVNLSSSQNKARVSKVKSDLSEISNAAEIILLDSAMFPGTANSATSLNTAHTTLGNEYALLDDINPAINATAQAGNQALPCPAALTAAGQLQPTAILAGSSGAFKDSTGSALIASIPNHPSGVYTPSTAPAAPNQTVTGYGYFWQGVNASGATPTKYSVFAADPSNLTTKIYYCSTGRNCVADSITGTKQVAQ